MEQLFNHGYSARYPRNFGRRGAASQRGRSDRARATVDQKHRSLHKKMFLIILFPSGCISQHQTQLLSRSSFFQKMHKQNPVKDVERAATMQHISYKGKVMSQLNKFILSPIISYLLPFKLRILSENLSILLTTKGIRFFAITSHTP